MPFVITGESGAGKTTVCEAIVRRAQSRGWDVAGILTPGRWSIGRRVGIDLFDIRAAERQPLAEIGAADGPVTEHWHFHAHGLAHGDRILRRALPCDLLVLDELGPLELVRGQGWKYGLDLLRRQDLPLALVVVRPALLPRLKQVIAQRELSVLEVTRANHASLLIQLENALRGQCD